MIGLFVFKTWISNFQNQKPNNSNRTLLCLIQTSKRTKEPPEATERHTEVEPESQTLGKLSDQHKPDQRPSAQTSSERASSLKLYSQLWALCSSEPRTNRKSWFPKGSSKWRGGESVEMVLISGQPARHHPTTTASHQKKKVSKFSNLTSPSFDRC